MICLPCERAINNTSHRQRLSSTSLDLSDSETVRLDLYYVDNWSLTYDLGILWRTIWVVLKRKGAY